jgi:tripartite-type tricarboxylate transporter receptor subunit TctC
MQKILDIFRKTMTMAIAASACATGLTLAAGPFPDKPIRVIVPYAVGGADTFIRPLQPTLKRDHGIDLVIETVTGAGGTVGANQVKRASADGYTLLFAGSGALTIAPVLQGINLSINDFEPITNLVSIPYIVAVRKESPLQSAAAFIDYAKRNPDLITYGSPGTGSAPHLALAATAEKLGTGLTHIPFSGISTAVQALLGGHITAVVGAPSVVMPQVRAGRLSALAITSKDRSALSPEIPTLAEAGVVVDVTTHFGFFAPKGTPDVVIQKLIVAIRDAARDQAFIKTMETMQNRIELLPGAAFTKALEQEAAGFAPIVAKLPKQ